MEKGYIHSRDCVVWRKKKSAFPALAVLAADAVDLGTSDAAGHFVVVYRCGDCRKFLIDTENGNHTEE